MATPYWVQIETQSKGNQTMFIQIDLTKVERVQVLRENDIPNKVILQYAGRDVGFDGKGTESFLKYWDEFAPINRKDEAEKAGIIQIAGTDGLEGLN